MTHDEGEAPDDAVLVHATLAGDAEAFGRLYDRYAPIVRAVCFDSTHDLSQAQDLSQDAFLRAYRKLAELRQPQSFGAWLIGIARHTCREWRRGAGRRRKHLGRFTTLAAGGQPVSRNGDAPVAADDDDELKQLRCAIAALPVRERDALHLFYLDEKPADAAADLLGLSRAGFYRALDRARTRLRRMLGLSIRSRSGAP